VRSRQYEDIISDLNGSPHWEETEVEESQKREWLPPYPKAFRRVQGSAIILLHDEASEKLLVDPPSDEDTTRLFQLEVLDCLAWNPVLVEEEMRPSANQTLYPVLSEALETGNLQVYPHTLCQSPNRNPQTKIHIPSISRYMEALVSQIKCLKSMKRTRILGPRYIVELLNRYLYFETPRQRRKIFELVNQETQIWLDDFLSKYRGRKPSEQRRLEMLLEEEELDNSADNSDHKEPE
jgi:hypothetical protein